MARIATFTLLFLLSLLLIPQGSGMISSNSELDTQTIGIHSKPDKLNMNINSDPKIDDQFIAQDLQYKSKIQQTADPTAFVSTWDTRNNGTLHTNSSQVLLPLVNTGSYNFTVDWGDGTSDEITSYSFNDPHTYEEPGIYTITITGEIVGFNFNSYISDRYKILEISQWGNLRLGNEGEYFMGCRNLVLTTTQPLNLTGTTDLSYMFTGTAIDHRGALNTWDTSSVTNMRGVFYVATSFNQPLDNWNTSSVTIMNQVFLEAYAFNHPLDSWDTSSVTTMNAMFSGATAFNQPLGSWNTSSVTDMKYMFSGATSFDQPLVTWNPISVTDMSYMFQNAESFDQNLKIWNTSSVTTMAYMFHNAISFDGNVGLWNTSSVVDMEHMFHGARSFRGTPGWDVSSVTDMAFMFKDAQRFHWSVNQWDTSSVTNMSYMLHGAATDEDWGFQSFNQSLSLMEIGNVVKMDNFIHNLTRGFYDDLLLNWSVQDVQPGVVLGMGASQYSNTTEVINARNLLIEKGWTIEDGGVYIPPPEEPEPVGSENLTIGFSSDYIMFIPLVLVVVASITRRKSNNHLF